MSLTILIRTQLNSIPVLADVCFSKANYGNNTNATLSVNTPRGVLGGSIAAVSAGVDYTAFPMSNGMMPIGLFVNDAAGAAFENAPAVASGKIAVIKGQPSVEVDVYETTGLSGGAYAVGQYLYGSTYGLLTNSTSASSVIIGVCTKAPSTVSPVLGLDMRI